MSPSPSAPVALFAAILVAVLAAGCATTPADSATVTAVPGSDAALSRREMLGKRLFEDTDLSEPAGTSCASCHQPGRAFAGNNGSDIGVAQGSRPGVFGFRNTPSAMYASFSPRFAVVRDAEGATPTGGQFLDGRVDTLAQQALLPLLSANEMNNTDAAMVVAKVAASSYAAQFRAEWGADIFSREADAFQAIGRSIEAFERSPRFHPFSSRFDDYLRGRDTLTAAERRGMSLFFDPRKGNCVGCHVADLHDSDPAASLFTDFTYDNLGVPRNPAIPANADPTFFDLGLGGPKRAAPGGDASLAGAFKVPTLRNVAIKQAFFHNGRFDNLDEVVRFYVTRDTDPTAWYPGGVRFDDLPPADRGNVNTSEPPYDRRPGQQPRLDAAERADLVAFLGTLTDREFEPLLPAPPLPTANQ